MSLNFVHRKHSVKEAYDIDRSYYYSLYVEQGKSTREIAKIIGVSQPIIRKILIDKKIPLRTYKENKIPIEKGGKMSEEHKRAISEALKGKVQPHLINPETGRSILYNRSKIICNFCHKEIEKMQTHIKNHKFHFCDNICHGKWKSENLIGENHPRYNRIEIKCTECDAKIITTPSSISSKGKRFCDRSCHDLWRSKHQTGATRYNWKGGYDNYYGESWPSAKKLARKRDLDTCQNCGKHKSLIGKNLDVHHIRPFKIFGVDNHIKANELSNLICYCPACHKIKEEEYNKSIRQAIDFQI